MSNTIIKLPHKLDEAIRILTVIDSFQGVRVTFDEIEKYCQFNSQSSAKQVMNRLVKAGVLDGMQSRLGGYLRKRKSNLLELMAIVMREDECKFCNDLPAEPDVRSALLYVQGRMANISV